MPAGVWGQEAPTEWTTNGNGSWQTGANWSGGAVPTQFEDILFRKDLAYTVQLNAPTTVKSMRVTDGNPLTYLGGGNLLSVTNDGLFGVSINTDAYMLFQGVAPVTFGRDLVIGRSGGRGFVSFQGIASNITSNNFYVGDDRRLLPFAGTTPGDGGFTLGTGSTLNVASSTVLGRNGGRGGGTVFGTGSNLSSTNGSLAVGYGVYHDAGYVEQSDGSLTIRDFGAVSYARTTIGGNGGKGSVVLLGSSAGEYGTLINTTGALSVGDERFVNGVTDVASDGRIDVLNGSRVINHGVSTQIGADGGKGFVEVDGTGSTFETTVGTLYVGVLVGVNNANVISRSDGTLNVSAGGRVTTALGTQIGASGGMGTVNISGATSAMTTATDLSVGENRYSINSANFVRSEGRLNVSAGGSLSSGQSQPSVAVIGGSGGVGSVSVSSGTADVSTWVNSGDVQVGRNATGLGTGKLTIGPGGYVDIRGTLLIANSQSVNLGMSGGTVDLTGGLLKVGRLNLDGSNTRFNMTGGTLIVGSGGIQSAGAGSLNIYGTLGGTTTIQANVSIQSGGHLAPGNSPGVVTINGDLSLLVGSFLDIQLAGTDAGEFDEVYANESLSLSDSNLSVELIDGYIPQINDTWAIVTMTNGSQSTGQFGNLLTSLDGYDYLIADGYQFRVDYNVGLNNNQIFLTVVPEPASMGILLASAATLLLKRRRI